MSEGFLELTNNFGDNINGSKSAIIDSSGKLLTSFEYFNNNQYDVCILPFENGYATVCKGDYWG